MRGVNKVILVGNIGADPQRRTTPNGANLATTSLAATETWKDKNGKAQERTEWVRLVFWGKLAEIAAQYVRKGDKIYIEGKLQTSSWQDEQGMEQRRTEVVVISFVMLGGWRQEEPQAEPDGNVAEFDNDIPF